MKKQPTNHRAILRNEGPAMNASELVARQSVRVRVVGKPIERPERQYQPGEVFACTLEEARAFPPGAIEPAAR